MTPIPQLRFPTLLDPTLRPTRPDMPAVKSPSGVVPRLATCDDDVDDRDLPYDVTFCSSVPLSDTTPTPLLPPPPGPLPARQSIPPEDLPVAVPEDCTLDLLMRTVPRIVRSRDEVAHAPIEHRDWFVLALVDGQTSVQGLVEIAGMEPDDALRVLQRLRRHGLITLV